MESEAIQNLQATFYYIKNMYETFGNEEGKFIPLVELDLSEYEDIEKALIPLAEALFVLNSEFLGMMVRTNTIKFPNDELRIALQKIAKLNPDIDSENGWNEWGEADCFTLAQRIAQDALRISSLNKKEDKND